MKIRFAQKLQTTWDMQITSSLQAYSLLKKYMIQDVEELWCLALGPSLKLLSIKMIFRGTVDSCTVHPRDIFRFACLKNASQLIIAHNHPSGDCSPSVQDLQFTHRIVFVGREIEIPIIDHLIITRKSYRSLADTKEIFFNSNRLNDWANS